MPAAQGFDGTNGVIPGPFGQLFVASVVAMSDDLGHRIIMQAPACTSQPQMQHAGGPPPGPQAWFRI